MGDPPGDACFYPDGLPAAVLTADCIKLTINRMIPSSNFFLYAMSSNVLKEQIVGITKGVAQLKVSLGRFAQIAFPFPPFPEQLFIAEVLDKHLSLAEHLEHEIDRAIKAANSLRQSLLERAFLGELVPQDPNDEPASVLLERIRAERQIPRSQTGTASSARLKTFARRRHPP
jgi:type I restriction enzyme S subunit